MEIIEDAQKKKKLEIRELPNKNLAHLKEAALTKKARAVQEIIKKTGDKNDLLYLGLSDKLKDKLLAHKVTPQGGH
jgi:hypothetical protein